MIGRLFRFAAIGLAALAAAPAGLLAQATQPDTTDVRRARAERRIEEQQQVEDRAALATELPDLFLRHVEWLADPAREGRAPGTRGIDEAADYIEDSLLAAGLEPAFADAPVDPDLPVERASPYRQPISVGVQVDTLQAHASFSLPNGRIITPTEIDVSPYSGTGAFAGACTFAGYAIVTGGGGYLGFTGAEDFNGRSIIMLSYEPMDELGRSLWSDKGWSFAAPLHRKLNAVSRRGAGAVFVVTPPDLDELTERTPETVREDMEPFNIPVIWLPGEVADAILRAGDPEHRGLDELYHSANKQGVVINLEGVASAVQTSVRIRTLTSDNIGAILPGRGDLADEYIVIGAHYDHLGRRDPDSQELPVAAERASGEIHPGADDNASGTAGLLIAAELLVRKYDTLPDDQPARSILFLAFTAEEMGLKGSAYYVEHPVAPIRQHVLMLNMDMIGRNMFNGLEIGGAESGESLPPLIETHVITSGLHARPMDSIGLDRSDQASFLGKQVPSVFFFTGLHDQYHTPYDTPDLIDEDGGAAIAELVADIAFDAATTPESPKWTGRTGAQPKDETESGRPKVRTGLVPAASATGEGMLVSRVMDNSSASDAGFKPGDRITSWNGTPINGPEDWIPLLVEAKPGDTVTVEFIRAGQSQTVEMTLQGTGNAGDSGGSGGSGGGGSGGGD